MNVSTVLRNDEVRGVHDAFVAVVKRHLIPARFACFLGKLLVDHARVWLIKFGIIRIRIILYRIIPYYTEFNTV